MKEPKRVAHPGASLKQWRKAQALSVNEVARRLDRAWQHVNGYETGDSTPNLETAVAIERMTGIPAASWVPDRKGRGE